MTKLKAGDRVRYIGKPRVGPPIGWTGTVREIWLVGPVVVFDNTHLGLISRFGGTCNTYYSQAADFELVPDLTPFEVSVRDYIAQELGQ